MSFLVFLYDRYCIMGDGCAMEGISNEAASLAGHLKLNKLTVIYDDNHNTIDGDTSLAFSENVSMRFQALGWNTINVEGIYDDLGTFESALDQALEETEKPTFIRVSYTVYKCSFLKELDVNALAKCANIDLAFGSARLNLALVDYPRRKVLPRHIMEHLMRKM